MEIRSDISQNENVLISTSPEAATAVDDDPDFGLDPQERPSQYSLRDAKEYLRAFEEEELPFISGKVTLRPGLLKALEVIKGKAPDTFNRWEDILRSRKQLPELQKALNKQAEDRPSTATQLVRLCDDIELLQDKGCDRHFFATVKVQGGRRYFATVKVSDHLETYRLNSLDMQSWLRNRFYEKTGQAASDRYVKDAIGVLQGRAQSQAREVPIYLRCGRDDVSGDVYIDLGRRDWKIVRIKADGSGFEVIDYAARPIRFRRSQVMEELSLPETGGTVLDIYEFLNVSTDWRLLDLAALTQAIAGNGPLVISTYKGGKGDGKTTTTRLRVSLVDPSSAMAAMTPKGADGLIPLARESYFVSLDNLSHLSQEMSDALCGLSTGTGIISRQFYTEFGLTAFKARRPIVINSIVDVANRADLLDRAIIIPVERLADRDIGKGRKRLTERELEARFKIAAPRLTGALYELVSYGLSRLSGVKLESTPRMADFVQWGCAIAGHPSLKPLWRKGKSGQQTFLDQYDASREAGNEIVRESSPIAYLLNQLLERHGGYLQETPTELLKMLKEEAGDRGPLDFPQSPKALKGHFDRTASVLEQIGIFIDHNENARPRIYKISKKEVSEVSDVSGIGKGIENKALFPVTSTDTFGESDVSSREIIGESPTQAINDSEEGPEELIELGWPAELAIRILQAISKKSATIIERTRQYVIYQCPDQGCYKISRNGQAERVYEN
jgi:hypothetical protein